jgi:hypothetical protein
MRGVFAAQQSTTATRFAAAFFALLTACGGRTTGSDAGLAAVPDASTMTDGANGGRGGTGGMSGGTAGGRSGASAVGGSGGSGRGGRGGSGAGGAGPSVDASPPIDSGNPPGPVDAGCSIACGSVPCPVRSGEPRVLVGTPLDRPIMAIAVSADTLYFGTFPNQTQGEISSMPLSGGAPTLLVGDVLVRELRLDGDTLYYVSRGRSGLSVSSLHAIPATGGTPKEIAQGSDITDVTPDASGVYFALHSSGLPSRIMHTGRDGIGTRTVVSAIIPLSGFAVDQEDVYWTGYFNGGVLVRNSLSSGTMGTLTGSMDPFASPISDGFDIDFVEGTSTPDACRSAVVSVSKSVGTPIKRISPGTSGVDVMGLVRDDTHLYWSSTGAHGAVVRVVKGQTPEIIAADQQSASRPVLGPKDVYWIARAGSMYQVRTVPK